MISGGSKLKSELFVVFLIFVNCGYVCVIYTQNFM